MLKKILKTLMLPTALLSCAIFAFYTMNKKEEIAEIPNLKEESMEIYHPVVTSEPSPKIESEPIFYYLQSEENMLVLYEINGSVQKEVKSTEINPEIFPYEDRELLKNGIKAFTLEEGIEIMENFIS